MVSGAGNREPSPYYGALQDVVDSLFPRPEDDPAAAVLARAGLGPAVRRLDIVMAADSADLPEELREVVGLLPPGRLHAPAAVRAAELRHRRPRLGPDLRHGGVGGLPTTRACPSSRQTDCARGRRLRGASHRAAARVSHCELSVNRPALSCENFGSADVKPCLRTFL